MPAAHDPQQNHLLAALSPAERERIYPHLRLVPMPLGKVLYESGDLLRHVYFPTDSIISLLYVLADGASAEISVVETKASSASRCSWAVRPPRVARSCRAPATLTGW